MAGNAYIEKEERSQINKLTLHGKTLKERTNKTKSNRKQKIIGIRVEKNEIENFFNDTKNQQNQKLVL